MVNKFEFASDKVKIKKQMEEVHLAAMEKILRIIKEAAKANAGQLGDRIDFSLQKTGDEIVGTVGSPEEYASYVEFGTGEFAENRSRRKEGWVYKDQNGKWVFIKEQEPQPFLRPAFRQNKETIKKILGQEYDAKFGGK